MAGGRRRRRNSKTGSIKSSGSDLTEEVFRAPPVMPEDSVSANGDEMEAEDGPAPTADGRGPLELIGSDDPFAYDSELETLSSVSSHSSISSSSGSVLDHPLDLAAEGSVHGHDHHHEQLSDAEEMSDCEEMSLEDNISGGSKAQSEQLDTAKGDQGRDGSGDHRIYTCGSPFGAAARNSESTSDKAASGGQTSDDDEGGGEGEGDNEDEHGPSERISACGGYYLSKPSASSAVSSKQATGNTLLCRRESDDDEMDVNEDEDSLAAFPTLISTAHTPDAGSRSPRADAQDDMSNEMDVDLDTEIEPPRLPENGAGVAGKELAAMDDEAGDAADEDNGNEEDEDEDEEDEDEDVLANEARRSEALAELTSIEIEFAKLRERLYSERLRQVQIEEEHLISGQHSDFERHVEKITSIHNAKLERLEFAHTEWLKQKQKLHESWQQTVNYTFLFQRQQLRSRMADAQQRRLWRLRDMRVQDDRRYGDKASARFGASAYSVDEDVALITQQASNIQQIKRTRRSAQTAQKCLVHMRKQRLAVSGLAPEEMDADYAAMQLPVFPREHAGGFRRLFVPSTAPGPGAVAGKKRKARQPRQPKKKQALDAGNGTPKGGAGPATPKPAATAAATATAVLAKQPPSVVKAAVDGSQRVIKQAAGNQQKALGRINSQQQQHQEQSAPHPNNRPLPPAPLALKQQQQQPSQWQQQQLAALPVNNYRPILSSLAQPQSTASAPATAAVVAPRKGEQQQQGTNHVTPANGASAAVAVAAANPAAGGTGAVGESGGKGETANGRGSVDMHVPPGSSGPLGLKA